LKQFKENPMAYFPHSIITADEAEAQLQAYNAAFDDLGLNWHWDLATFFRVRALGRDAIRQYLTSEHSNLLRVYDADSLARAIEAAKARHHMAVAAID
jgi:hypothetical protein